MRGLSFYLVDIDAITTSPYGDRVVLSLGVTTFQAEVTSTSMPSASATSWPITWE